MKFTVKEIHAPEEKGSIAKEVLYDLPEWFGLPESTEESISWSRKKCPSWQHLPRMSLQDSSFSMRRARTAWRFLSWA